MNGLTPADLYVLARAFVGMPTDGIECSPATRLVVDAIDWQTAAGMATARQIFGGMLSEILAVDPNTPPAAPTPARQRRSTEEPVAYVPPLPDDAQLSAEALAAMDASNHWYHEARAWLMRRSPMTPVHFLEAGLLWSVGLAVNRRVCVEFHERIYPTLYTLLVAETSRYAKSTGLNALYSLVMSAMPHMLMPGQTTPEGLIELMAGQLPGNYDKLGRTDQALIDEGRKFAAQRGILLDEFSSLLGSHKKDYMQGFIELLMRLYDSRDVELHYTKSGGMLIIRWPGLSILGATTPAAMARAITTEMWENGANARYLMMFRDQPLDYNPNYITYLPPPELVGALLKLHNTLPRISPDDALESDTSFQPTTAAMDSESIRMYQAYTKAVYNDMIDDDLDPRLHGNYKRLHIQALKMALGAACMDWATAGATGPITIRAGHWALGQTLAEKARNSLHRLMPVLSQSDDSRIQRDLAGVLRHSNHLTVRDLVRMTGRNTKDVRSALEVLIESGEIERIEHHPPNGGRPTTLYKIVD